MWPVTKNVLLNIGDPQGGVVKTISCCYGNMSATGVSPVHPLQIKLNAHCQLHTQYREDKLNKQLFTINSSVFCPSRAAKWPATPHGRASVVRWGTAHLQGVFSHKNQKLKSCRLEYENTFQWYMGALSHSECVRSDKSVLLGVISTCDSLCCLQMWYSVRFYLVW